MIQSEPVPFRPRPGQIISLPTAFAFLIVSAAAVALNGCRVVATGHWNWLFLSWNLCLAWVPLILAWGVCHWSAQTERTSWKIRLGALGWLLFFPNSPYVFTDLVHLGKSGHLYWLDLLLISLFALTSLVLGFVSLRLMHELVATRLGWVAGWLFIGVVATLSGVGVFIGRFLRWNSWDAVVRPWDVLRSLIQPEDLPAGRLKFTLLFAAFVFLSYLMLHALTHMRPRASNLPAWPRGPAAGQPSC